MLAACALALAACQGASEPGFDPILPRLARYEVVHPGPYDGTDWELLGVVQVPWGYHLGLVGPAEYRQDRMYVRRSDKQDVTIRVDAVPAPGPSTARPCYTTRSGVGALDRYRLTDHAILLPRTDGVAAICLPVDPSTAWSAEWTAVRLLERDGVAIRCEVSFQARYLPVAFHFLKICDTLDAKLCSMTSRPYEAYARCGAWSRETPAAGGR